MAVVPAAARAFISVTTSSAVAFRALHFDGGAGGPGVAMDFTATATGVAVVDSTFLHCSSPYCIRTFVARRR